MTADGAKRAILENLGGRGDKFRCPVPTHGRGRGDINPSASVDVSPAGKFLVACPCCEQRQLVDELKGRGLWPGSGSGSSREGWHLRATWRYFGPDGNRDQEDFDTPTEGRQRRWAGGLEGIKPKRLIAIERGEHDLPGRKYHGPILIVEGAKTAAAAHALSQLPALGFASSTAKKGGRSAGQLPDDDVLEWAGASCASEFWICPDNDQPGIKAGTIMARRLQGLYPDAPVLWIDPSNLIDMPPSGWDLGDWDGRWPRPLDVAGYMREAAGKPPAARDTGIKPTTSASAAQVGGDATVGEHHLAELWAAEHGADWRCQSERDHWLQWSDAEGWQDTMPGIVIEHLGRFGRARLKKIVAGATYPDPPRGAKYSTASATSKFARAMAPIATRTGDWDSAPDVIGLPGNRVLQAVDGKLVERDRTRDDLVSKALAARPDWKTGVWSEHLETLFDDPTVAAYLQALAGYALLNRGTEDKIVLCPGRGGTGKTVTFGAITAAVGDYGATCDPNAISGTGGRPVHPVGRMAFIGRRIVVSPELDSGCTLDGAFCKRLSGGDELRARGMHENESTFTFGGLLFVYTNAEPTLIAPDDGLKRRILVLPFEKRRQNPDVNFGRRINLSHVVGWMVEGARFYLEHGMMATPASVVAASRAFHEDADPISSFVDRWLLLAPTASTPVRTVYERYQAYCNETGQLRPLTARTLLKRLREGGFGMSTRKTMGLQWVDGCTLRDDREAA